MYKSLEYFCAAMKNLRYKAFRTAIMVISLAIMLPLITSGFTIRISHCSCDKGQETCSLKDITPQNQEKLPPCCQPEKNTSKEKHGCQDECCLSEFHVDGIDAEYLSSPQNSKIGIASHDQFNSISFISGIEKPRFPFLSTKGPPGLRSGKLFLISIHQLRIPSPSAIVI